MLVMNTFFVFVSVQLKKKFNCKALIKILLSSEDVNF